MSNTIMKIEFRDLIDQDELIDLGETWMNEQVAKVKAGKAIHRGYKPSTIKRRKRFGLQTSHIDLTGNNAYSKKGWRLLNTWSIRAHRSGKALTVFWRSSQARTLYGHIVKRFGEIF